MLHRDGLRQFPITIFNACHDMAPAKQATLPKLTGRSVKLAFIITAGRLFSQ